MAPRRRRQLTVARSALLVLLLSGLLGACGGGSSTAVRRPSSPGSTASPTTATIPPTTSPGATGHQTITVTPSKDLAPNQQVTVTGSGFSPNEPLVVTQCADKGAATGMGDCNLAGMKSVVSDATGRVETTLTVVSGPFGGNQIVCGPTQPCLISVTQATPSPTEEADAVISFR